MCPPGSFPLLLFSVVAAALLATTSWAQAPKTNADGSTTTDMGNIVKIADVPYVSHGHPRQRLDLYLPSVMVSSAPRPLVVYIHGGAWEAGNKKDVDPTLLLRSGYCFASVEYRFSQDAVFPAQIEDCKAAIRWLRAHAGEHGIDPARIGVWGDSAGGHLVALLGTTGQRHDFDVGENLEQSSAVQCVLDWFGPTDFLHWGADPSPLHKTDSAITRLLGGPADADAERARRASPLYFVSKESAPFLIYHGDRDTIVPLEQSRALDEALRKAGVPSQLVVLPGAGHSGPAFYAAERIRAMGEFLDRYLKPRGD